MEIMNTLYYDSALVLPHRPYDLLTGEFRKSRGEHFHYLGSGGGGSDGNAEGEGWDSHAVLAEAKFLHFSDWPVNKPWMKTKKSVWDKEMPRCLKWENGTMAGNETEVDREARRKMREGSESGREGSDGEGGERTVVDERFNVTDVEGMDCRDRDVWIGAYADFAERRLRICGLDLVEAAH